MIISTLEDILQMLKTKKIQANEDGNTEKARHLALAYTEIEIALIRLKSIDPEESEL